MRVRTRSALGSTWFWLIVNPSTAGRNATRVYYLSGLGVYMWANMRDAATDFDPATAAAWALALSSDRRVTEVV